MRSGMETKAFAKRLSLHLIPASCMSPISIARSLEKSSRVYW
jgi:hypothetical protein